MNAEMMSNLVDVELIYEGIKYPVKVSRLQPTGGCGVTWVPGDGNNQLPISDELEISNCVR